jgi:hypothetical protein
MSKRSSSERDDVYEEEDLGLVPDARRRRLDETSGGMGSEAAYPLCLGVGEMHLHEKGSAHLLGM